MLTDETLSNAFRVLTEKHARQVSYSDRRDLPLNLVDLKIQQDKQTDPFEFEGYGSVWNRVDSYGDTVLKGAFTDSLKTRKPMMFFGHNPGRVPGKWLTAKEDANGLKLRGQLTTGHSEAKDLEASLRHGSLSGMSIGGYTEKSDWIEEEGKIIGRKIKQFSLYEVSIVSMPAENEARIDGSTIKSMLDECETIAELESLLREAGGFSKSSATAFVARMRRMLRGEPGGEASAEVSSLLETIRGATFPTSLFGDPK